MQKESKPVPSTRQLRCIICGHVPGDGERKLVVSQDGECSVVLCDECEVYCIIQHISRSHLIRITAPTWGA